METTFVNSCWYSRQELTTAWHELARSQDKKLALDRSKGGGRCARVICTSCTGFYFVATCNSEKVWRVNLAESCLDHYNVEGELKVPCTGMWTSSSKEIANSKIFQAIAKAIPRAGGKRSLSIERQVDMLRSVGIPAS